MDALIRLKDYVYCIEFKLDESATKAIEQIKRKGYLTPLLMREEIDCHRNKLFPRKEKGRRVEMGRDILV
jgi:hypothetical protein